MGSMFSRFCNQQNNCDYCEDNNKENNLKIDSNNDKVINNKNLNIDQNIESNYTSKVNQLSTVLNRKPSMDVTRHNFIETISQLEEVLKECQFISIDCELSGLRREWKSLSLMDTTNDRYFKLKQSIIGYQTIQFGLTAFKPIGDNESQYTCNSYNFYIFPQKSSTIPKANGDRTFSVQSSSLTFLVNNGFDFNKLIRDGISYLNREEEQICVEAINAQNELKANKSNTAINSAVTDEDKKFVNEILEKINSFITNDSLQNIDLSPCNGFKRKLIYETLKAQEFIDSIDIKTIPVSQNSFDRYIAVNKINKEEKERKQSEMLTEAIGFSKVVQLIIKYGKPVVGHNVLLDIMHTFNQFIEPLPDHYFEFKQSINALFPVLYDTKYISSTQVFKELLENTALGDLFDRVMRPPFKPIDVKLLNGVFIEGKSMHEAGYDSYITGLVFIGLIQYLGSLGNPQISHYDPFLMSDYRNKLYLTYAYDIPYLNFEGEDIVPDRSHVFHVSFPNDWKTNELFHLFSAFGGVTISWINETSAFCALKDSNNIEKIKKSLIKQSSNTYKVISYYDFIAKAALSPKELIRDNIKQNSKTRASPQELNPIKKTKVYETNTFNIGNKQKKSKLSKQNKPKKLFEESKDWSPD